MLLPGPWSDRHRRERTREQLLWLAVFNDAISCAVIPVNGTGRLARRRESARQWIADTDILPGSFAWVCDVLGLPIDALRKRVLETARYLKPPRLDSARCRVARLKRDRRNVSRSEVRDRAATAAPQMPQDASPHGPAGGSPTRSKPRTPLLAAVRAGAPLWRRATSRLNPRSWRSLSRRRNAQDSRRHRLRRLHRDGRGLGELIVTLWRGATMERNISNLIMTM
jgi:hypothetical protein